MERIVIIGAGSVGINIALFLDKLAFEVVLLDHASDILEGSAQVTCVNHGDGFEYYTKGHKKTGYYCIDGSLTKALIYPLAKLRTKTSTNDLPIRFFLTAESVRCGIISEDDFRQNVIAMSKHFTQRFNAIKHVRDWSNQTAFQYFLREPNNFYRELVADEYDDVANVAAGYAGSSFGINMPQYYAITKAALRGSKVECRFGEQVDKIERTGRTYQIHTHAGVINADHILLSCAHQIPRLASMIRGEKCVNRFKGTFYLNSMSYIRLPSTDDHTLLKKVNRINFALQQESGGMFACIAPATKYTDGYAAIYYPSPSANQLYKHEYSKGHHLTVPASWDNFIKNGLPNSNIHVKVAFAHIVKLYPFLENYAVVERTKCRTVFNPATPQNRKGLIRSVREISSTNGQITADHRVSAWAAPKWTNAELVALMAVDYVCKHTNNKRLPKDKLSGCGPTNLNVAELSKAINFHNIEIDEEDAIRYARVSDLPTSMIDTDIS